MTGLWRSLVILGMAIIAGCGGGGSGGGAASAPPTPAGTAVNLTAFKNFYTGTSGTGTQMSFNLTGSDTQGGRWTGSFALISDGATTFEGQDVTSSRIQVTLNHVNSGTSATATTTHYFLRSNGDILKMVDSDGTVATPTAQTQIPATLHVGDTGHLYTTSNSDGSANTVSWSLDPDVNGNSRFVISSVITQNSVILGQEKDTFYLDPSGNPIKYSVTITESGISVTLAGDRT